MGLRVLRVAMALVLLATTTAVSAEPDWLTKWKTFINDKVLVSDEGDGQEATEASSGETAAQPAPEPRPAPVLQTGNPGDFTLTGSWILTSAAGRTKIGSLKADGRYFTLKLNEPKVDLRTAYMQAADGGFRCTVLDKEVITMEGRFENKDRIDFQMQVKEIGRPAITKYALVAKRER